MVKKRRLHTAAQKFRIALEALEGSKTISQLSSEHEVHPNMIRAWKRQLLEDGSSVLARSGEPPAGRAAGSGCRIPLIDGGSPPLAARGAQDRTPAEERFVLCSEPAAFA